MSRGRHAAPLRLTRRGRIVRGVVIGGACLGLVLFGQPISVAFFSLIAWMPGGVA